jgi:CheY-like chemotaxis protein
MISARSAKHGDGRFGRVLVIEDDPVLALSIQLALEDAGASQVIVCPSIACTMDVLEQSPPDALVIDVHLADRDDGWAVAELVDALGPRRPRIAFSTGTPEDIPPEIAAMGPVFVKPYDPAELAQALAGGARPGLFARFRAAKP